MDLNQLTLTDLKRGWSQTATAIQCNYCDTQWPRETAPASWPSTFKPFTAGPCRP